MLSFKLLSALAVLVTVVAGQIKNIDDFFNEINKLLAKCDKLEELSEECRKFVTEIVTSVYANPEYLPEIIPDVPFLNGTGK